MSFERLADVVDTPQESNEDDKKKIPLPSIQGGVRFEGTSFRFLPNAPEVLKKIDLNIPAGTQSETQFRLKSKGMSILRQTRRGDMYVEVNVEIPVNLNSKQKAILQEFEKEGGTSKKHSPKSQSFFSKLKEVWEDLT